MASASNILMNLLVSFPFLWAFWLFLDLVVRFFLSCFVSLFSLLTWRILYVKFHSHILTVYSHCLYQGYQFPFVFSKQFDCQPCTWSGWSFLDFYRVCILLCISWECDWVASSLWQIVIVIAYLPGICHSGSFPLLRLFLLLSIPLSRFVWCSR